MIKFQNIIRFSHINKEWYYEKINYSLQIYKYYLL
jgi:hypothetical protein